MGGRRDIAAAETTTQHGEDEDQAAADRPGHPLVLMKEKEKLCGIYFIFLYIFTFKLTCVLLT